MRVPRIGAIYTPKVRSSAKKLVDPPSVGNKTNNSPSFGYCVSYYLKKYKTLPEEVQKMLSPKDAIDMFREMEFVANGAVKRKAIGQGAQAKVYENPWLNGYDFIVLNKANDANLTSETIYSKKNYIGDAIWCDKDDKRIQILTA